MISSLLLLGLQVIQVSTGSHSPQCNHKLDCSKLKQPKVDGIEVINFSARRTEEFGLDVCDVNIHLTHGNANDTVRVQALLPVTDFNGRFKGTGGGGLSAGYFDERLAESVTGGFAVAATDAGLNLEPGVEPPSLEPAYVQQILTNFAYLSVHEMTLVGKALVEQAYGEPADRSYFVGCSMGGRQGLVEAQRYPEDYDGVFSYSPVADWPRYSVATLWPWLVQVQEDAFPDLCVWEAITAVAVEACDTLDGGEDGVIGNPLSCDFKASSIIGQSVCDDIEVTKAIAKVWDEVAAGPTKPDGSRAWYGFPVGTNLTRLVPESTFLLNTFWTAMFVEDAGDAFDENTIPAAELYLRLEKSSQLYGRLFTTDQIDLKPFRDAGAKLLVWHGLADGTVPPQDIIRYRQRAESGLNQGEDVDEFFRLFTAPGADHCRGGIGAIPIDPLGQLLDWVEDGVAPETLAARGDVGERELCLWPGILTHTGEGDLSESDSWTCT